MSRKIASVVINNSAKEIDKVFHYYVPDCFSEDIAIGKRVFVPFGASNKKTEAYILDIIDKSNIKDLKEIIKIIDKKPLFNKDMVKLAIWMRKRYICTYYEAIKTICPPGISTNTKEYIFLNSKICKNELEKNFKSAPLQKEIIDILNNTEGHEIEIGKLKEVLGNKNIATSVNSLFKKGIIFKTSKSASRVSDKTVKIVEIIAEYVEVQRYIDDNEKKAPVQVSILKKLIDNKNMLVSDLRDEYKTVDSTIKKLEEKNLVEIYEKEVFRDVIEKTEIIDDFELTAEQNNAIKYIIKESEKSIKKPFLLYGVTGSGKTEVFIQIIREYIKKGKKALILVPEISLTTQMVQRFVKRFGERIAVFHSGLSLGERYDQWKKVVNSEIDIAIGARSAIFLPLTNLGITIIDEEHENTYKSESSPRYDTKEIARFRGLNENATVIYSSATPSIESYFRAMGGSYHLVKLTKRYNNVELPEVEIIDMRKELIDNKSIFSFRLIEEIESNLNDRKQIILFLNRRGYSNFVSCRNCGFVFKCKNCNISLKYHISSDSLKCHFCGYTKKNIKICPECGSKYVKYFGIGTQKIEEEVKIIFPEASTIRMDIDTTSAKFAHEKIINKFINEKIDILVGTQMISKGLDFHNVALIGVVAADMSLNMDDYRASERTFQLLTQVSGRAGRREERGKAIIQTYDPDNYTLKLSKEQNFDAFYTSEISVRKELNYPPYCLMVLINVDGENEEKVIKSVNSMYNNLIKIEKEGNFFYNILGPSEAPVSRIKKRYRWRIIIKCVDSWEAREKLRLLSTRYYKDKKNKHTNMFIDINPVNMY
jgi:primosomal protein N' (replication factor Y)